MIVTCTKKPSTYLVVRYRKCLACDRRSTTEERISKTRKSTHVAARQGSVEPMA
jgi:transcriptional regulator NrdR family protein